MTAARGHVVFDLDGTLVDSVVQIGDILAAMLAERGIDRRLSRADLEPHITGGGTATIEALLGGSCGPTDIALAEFRERYAAIRTRQESVYPGAYAALEALRADGFTLAVFSNKTQGLCDKVLGDVGLGRLFAAIIGTGPEAPHKPDPTGYFLALSRSGGTVARSCLVGDSDADEALAARAGVPLIFAAWGYGALAGPSVAVARTFAEVPGLVARSLPAEARA